MKEIRRLLVRGGWLLVLWMAMEPLFPGQGSPQAAEWLPQGPLYPRSLSDPHEPRLGVAYAPAPKHVDASLGAPRALAEFFPGEHPLQVVLEGAGFLRLGRDGSFYPLRTVDGFFGLGLETRRNNLYARLRLMHWSAHTADGDSTVSFPGRTFSREFWELETGLRVSGAFVYVRIGSAWHSVPGKKGMDCAAGGTWRGSGSYARPVVSIHLAADAERSWRVNQSLFGGLELGSRNPLRVGLRGFRGNSFRGQYWKTSEQYFGVEFQFIP